MEEAFTLNTPREQLEHIINGAIDNIHRQKSIGSIYTFKLSQSQMKS